MIVKCLKCGAHMTGSDSDGVARDETTGLAYQRTVIDCKKCDVRWIVYVDEFDEREKR